MSAMQSATQFFSRPTAKAALEDLAQADKLTVITGAGVSIDSGSPDWRSLVSLLLKDALGVDHRGDEGFPANDAQHIAGLLSGSMEPIRAASIVRRLMPDTTNLRERVRAHLYADFDPNGPLPEAVVALAVLAALRNVSVKIVTPNFDNNLETTQLVSPDMTDWFTLRSVTDGAIELGASEIPVYHLHGHIRNPDLNGIVQADDTPIVLCEEEFVKQISVGGRKKNASWQEKLLRPCFTETTCLFVGTSLTDPNHVRLLVETQPHAKGRRYALFAAETFSEWRSRAGIGWEEVRAVWEERCRHLGVEPLVTDYIGQIPQFLHEINVCATVGHGSYTNHSLRYGMRLNSWWEEWSAARLPSDRDAFVKIQEGCNRVLREGLVDVRSLISESPDDDLAALKSSPVDPNEKLKLEVWVRFDPHNGRMMKRWASSQVAWSEPDVLHSCLIEIDSRFASVEAFCRGHIVRKNQSDGRGRWASYLAQPVFLRGPKWSRLPVGVITIWSSRSKGDSALDHLDNPALAKLRGTLQACAYRILDPDSELTKTTDQ